MSKITWIVVRDDAGRYLALSPEDFEALQLDLTDVVRYIREADAQIDYYREQI